MKFDPVDLDKVIEGFRRWLRPEEEVTLVDIERRVLEIEEPTLIERISAACHVHLEDGQMT